MIELAKFGELTAPYGLINVVVSQNGEVVGRFDREAPVRRNIYSASKSFTSAAVGIAQREGLLSIEERLVDAFRDDLPAEVSENLEAATVRDLLTMCLGQPKPYLMGPDRPYYPERDWVKSSLAQPFTDRPGTKFLYNNAGPYLAGVLVQRRAGCDLVSYLSPRMLEPMGIVMPTWETDPYRRTFGAGGMFLTVDELHRFGQLYLQDGCWEGRQLVPADWVKASTSVQARIEGRQTGYGYLFWEGRYGSFRADGKYSQLSILFRDKNAVVSTAAECRDGDALMEAIYTQIYPQL